MNYSNGLKLLVAFGFILLTVGVYTVFNGNFEEQDISSKSKINQQYQEFLETHPFRKEMQTSKEDRIARELPPNKFYEQEFLYTSNPELLRPTPEKLYEVQKGLRANAAMRTAPGDVLNEWEERGPNTVGGRTHELMFAPGSTQKVFAGSVSGGLWINDDITDASSQWYEVESIPGNLAVMSITYDPNDTDVMYLGTGEIYTSGDVVGNGIYKSVDGGNTWFELFTGPGTSLGDRLAFVQDVIAWNNPTTNQTEVYFGAGSTIYREEVTSTSGNPGWNWLGLNTIGLWKSTDGVNFTRQTGPVFQASSNYYSPNSFDTDANGNLWMGTRRNAYGAGGGYVFSNDGTGWTNVRNLNTGDRVEIACSKQDANKIYVLVKDNVNTTVPAKIFRTDNAFTTAPSQMGQPNDADTGISANDFTRGQSFYDLMIGVDPLNDDRVFVGGIDIFESTNGAVNWSQRTHWYGGFGFQYTHADQHGIAFATETGANTSRVIFGNDGGVYYSADGGATIEARNLGYNATQFYKGAINQQTADTHLLAGAQDNGSHLMFDANPGINTSNEVTGGDGCWVFIDKDDQYMISSYVYNNYRYIDSNGTYIGNFPGETNDGDFVNQCGLDSDTNVLYSNGGTFTTGPTTRYRIYRWAINPAGPGVTKSTLPDPTYILDGTPTFFVASPYISDRILVGTTAGSIFRISSASGTPTWVDITANLGVGAVSDIRYGANENTIMVTMHNYGVTSIYQTTDGGTSWVSKEGDLPDMPVKCIIQNPANTNEVIIGTALGVWQTSNWNDVSPNWTQSQNGMKDVKVMSFDYRDADGTILAATYGRGMFTGQFITTTCASATTYTAGGWSNGAPTINTTVRISSDYNTSVQASFDACELIVDAGVTLTVDEGDYIRVNNNIGVEGTLQVNKTANVVQVNSDGVTTKAVGGTIRVEVETPVLENRHFVVMGSPMSAEQRTGVFKDAFLVLDFHPENFLPHPDVPSGGTNFADDDGDYYQMYEHGRILLGEGYVVRPQTGYTDPAGIPYPMTFELGTLNTGTINYLAENRGSTLNPNGTPNVLANPYPSAISADLFMAANPTIDALYYWEHLTAPGQGLAVSNLRFDMDDISIYNGTMGLPAANDPGNTLNTAPNNVIPTAQGFGIRTTGIAGLRTSITFDNSMRLTSGNTILRTQENTPSTLLLELREENYKIGGFTGIAFSEQGSSGLDHRLDTRRLGTVASLFSHLEDGSEQLGIQTREPFSIEQEVKMGFASQLNETSNYTVSLSSVEGNDFAGVTIWLEDNQTGVITNLRESSYTFTSDGGTFEDRFLLRFEEDSLGADDQVTDVRIFPNPAQNILNVVTPQHNIDSVLIFDMMGRVVQDLPSVNSNSVQLDISNLRNAIYFVEIRTNIGTISKKIVKN